MSQPHPPLRCPCTPCPHQDALNFITGHINYGGRVTDDQDRRCLISILRKYFRPDILGDDYRFSTSGKYYAPAEGTLQDLNDYLGTLPTVRLSAARGPIPCEQSRPSS